MTTLTQLRTAGVKAAMDYTHIAMATRGNESHGYFRIQSVVTALVLTRIAQRKNPELDAADEIDAHFTALLDTLSTNAAAIRDSGNIAGSAGSHVSSIFLRKEKDEFLNAIDTALTKAGLNEQPKPQRQGPAARVG